MGRFEISVKDTHKEGKEAAFSKDAVVMVRSEIKGVRLNRENPEQSAYDVHEDVFTVGVSNRQDAVERLANGILSLCFDSMDQATGQLNVCAAIRCLIDAARLSDKVTFEIGPELQKKRKELMTHAAMLQ